MGKRGRLLLLVPVVVVLVAGYVVYGRVSGGGATAYALVNESMLTALRGLVELQRGGAGERVRVAPKADVAVRVGDRAETGADGYAVVTYFDGSTTEMEPNTALVVQKLDKLPGGGESIAIHQEAGQTWNRVERLADVNSRFETNTATAVAYVRGTEYKVIVGADGGTTIEVYEGTVTVEAGGVTVEVTAGNRTRVPPGGPPSAPEPIPPAVRAVQIAVEGPVRPFLTDSVGRSEGFQPDVDAYGSQIPGAIYAVGAGGQTLTIPDPVDGYEVVLSAVGDGGSYTLRVSALVNGEPVAERVVGGLARALEAEELSGTLSRGQHLGTGFEYRSGEIVNFRRPGTLVGGAPAASRMLFIASQRGNAARVEQTAVALATRGISVGTQVAQVQPSATRGASPTARATATGEASATVVASATVTAGPGASPTVGGVTATATPPRIEPSATVTEAVEPTATEAEATATERATATVGGSPTATTGASATTVVAEA